MGYIMKKDKLKTKIAIMTISLLLVLLVIGLYCLDTSMSWNGYKIGSCVIISLWLFFILPSLRGFYLEHKNEDMEYWCKTGSKFGISGLFLPLLLAPYYGILFYHSN